PALGVDRPRRRHRHEGDLAGGPPARALPPDRHRIVDDAHGAAGPPGARRQAACGRAAPRCARAARHHRVPVAADLHARRRPVSRDARRPRRRPAALDCAALAATLFPVLWLFALAAVTPFVKVNGVQFVAGDQPFAFVGANLAVMHGQGRAHYQETLAAARADGFTVGRIWALGEGAAGATAWSRENELFRAGPDGWLEPPFVHLDRVLAEARARGLRLI